MKRIVVVALVAAAALLAATCTSTQSTHWAGLPIARAVEKFGQPRETTPSSDGTSTYVFVQKKQILCRIVPTAPEHGSGALGGVCGIEHRRWTFIVDGRGVITALNVGEWKRDPRSRL